MNRMNRTATSAYGMVIVSAMLVARVASAAPDGWSPVEVRGGTAIFDAATNISAINVHGKSTELDARASVLEGPAGLSLERVEATLPVKASRQAWACGTSTCESWSSRIPTAPSPT